MHQRVLAEDVAGSRGAAPCRRRSRTGSPARDPGRGRRGRRAASARASRSRCEPSQSPSGILTPSVVIPSATTCVRSAISRPSSIITARRTSSSRRDISSPSAVRVRSMNMLRDRRSSPSPSDAASTSLPTGSPTRGELAGRDAGEHPVHHRPRQRVAVGEVPVRLRPAARARRRPCASAAGAPPRAGRPASSTRPRGRDASRRGRGRACPSGPRPRRPRAPSARARRRARRRR